MVEAKMVVMMRMHVIMAMKVNVGTLKTMIGVIVMGM
jgi:hypothetical protein